MFNNPFDSFHNTVGKAKDDREQLDQLLTISTPRERSLIVAIALLVLTAALWFVFGNVNREYVVDGVLLKFEESTTVDTDSVQVLVWIDSNVASSVRSGMRTELELSVPEKSTEVIDGTVSSFVEAQRNLESNLLSDNAPASLYRIGIALDKEIGFDSNIGQECRIIIELVRQSPLSLLRGRRS